mmetsp:Transcript_5513/g.23356  ORF Transcript_5513/g.23356 Transcript_5513/m.23356 type:complete len:268 (+) Transcript_5513:1480-2283(+)
MLPRRGLLRAVHRSRVREAARRRLWTGCGTAAARAGRATRLRVRLGLGRAKPRATGWSLAQERAVEASWRTGARRLPSGTQQRAQRPRRCSKDPHDRARGRAPQGLETGRLGRNQAPQPGAGLLPRQTAPRWGSGQLPAPAHRPRIWRPLHKPRQKQQRWSARRQRPKPRGQSAGTCSARSGERSWKRSCRCNLRCRLRKRCPRQGLGRLERSPLTTTAWSGGLLQARLRPKSPAWRREPFQPRQRLSQHWLLPGNGSALVSCLPQA